MREPPSADLKVAQPERVLREEQQIQTQCAHTHMHTHTVVVKLSSSYRLFSIVQNPAAMKKKLSKSCPHVPPLLSLHVCVTAGQEDVSNDLLF